MLKHYDFDCGLVGQSLLPDSWMRTISNLNNPVSRPLCPKLGGMTAVVRCLDIDPKNLCLRSFYVH